MTSSEVPVVTPPEGASGETHAKLRFREANQDVDMRTSGRDPAKSDAKWEWATGDVRG
jgi:hypothetical protein